MKQYKINMITKSQRVMAYLLLACQLLTSCGGNNTLFPRDPNAQLTKTVLEQQAICSEDNELEYYPQPTSFIDATPLKLGQTEIQFVWDQKEGLQAFTIDSSMGSMDTYVIIQNTPIIKDVNGKPIHFSQLNKKQAEFIANGLKWEVNQVGELKERGVRLRGGGRGGERGSGKGGIQGKDIGKGEIRDAGQEVGNPKASAKASRPSGIGSGASSSKAPRQLEVGAVARPSGDKEPVISSAACASATPKEQPKEQQDAILSNALYAAIQFIKHISMGKCKSVYAYLTTIKKKWKEVTILSKDLNQTSRK